MRLFEKLRKFSEYVEITHISPAEVVESPPAIESEPQSESLQETVVTLQEAMRKLGRTQLRANTVAESERKEIKQMLQAIVAASTTLQKEPLGDLLLVVDGLEEGLRAIEKLNQGNNPTHAWADGFRIVHERLLGVLKRWNIIPIESVGQPFVPHLHHAVDVIHTDEVAENIVMEEQQRGYLCGEEVLRYAQVVVARRKAGVE